MIEPLSTKTTRVAPGLYGCVVFNDGVPVVEVRVPRSLISSAYKDMFRTLDKLGFQSRMAHSSRMRGKNHQNVNHYRYIWHKDNRYKHKY